MHSFRFVFLIAFWAACGSASPGYSEAREHFSRGDFARAELAATDGLARSPDDAALWRLRIATVVRSGDSARAVALYMKWHHRRKHYDPEALRAMAVSTLWRSLRDRQIEIRKQAIAAAIEAAALAPGGLAAAVAERLGDGESRVAAQAALALADLGSEYAAWAQRRAIHLLGSGDAQTRSVAVTALGRTGQRERVMAALSDPAAVVRRAAVRALGRKPGSELGAVLARIARSDPDGSVRATALRSLVASERDLALSAGRTALSDAYPGARLAGMALLARWPEHTRATLVERAASSDDLYVALRAAVALRKAGQDPPFMPVQLALGHRLWNIRVAALNAVTEIVGAQAALALASGKLGDDRIEVRLAAARVLARLGQSGRAAQTFAAALEADTAEPRLQAAIDLLRLKDERGYRALIALGRNASPNVRARAAGAHRYTERLTLPLVSALGDSSAQVRVAAAVSVLLLLEPT